MKIGPQLNWLASCPAHRTRFHDIRSGHQIDPAGRRRKLKTCTISLARLGFLDQAARDNASLPCWKFDAHPITGEFTRYIWIPAARIRQERTGFTACRLVPTQRLRVIEGSIERCQFAAPVHFDAARYLCSPRPARHANFPWLRPDPIVSHRPAHALPRNDGRASVSILPMCWPL